MDYRDTNIFVALEHLTPLCLSFLFIYFEEMYQDV
jgi:hypothetical protein